MLTGNDSQMLKTLLVPFLNELNSQVNIDVRDHQYFQQNSNASVYYQHPTLYVYPKWRDRTNLLLIVDEAKAAVQQAQPQAQLSSGSSSYSGSYEESGSNGNSNQPSNQILIEFMQGDIKIFGQWVIPNNGIVKVHLPENGRFNLNTPIYSDSAYLEMKNPIVEVNVFHGNSQDWPAKDLEITNTFTMLFIHLAPGLRGRIEDEGDDDMDIYVEKEDENHW